MMFCKWKYTFHFWGGTCVTKLFPLLVRRAVREICVCVGLSEYLWDLTIFFALVIHAGSALEKTRALR